jgi:hypothetical protein
MQRRRIWLPWSGSLPAFDGWQGTRFLFCSVHKGECQMSHVVEVQLQVKDLDCLQAAAKRLGLVLNRNQTTYRWWGRSVGDYPIPEGFTAEDLGKCEHAVSLPNDDHNFEIGVCRQKGAKHYTLLYDFFGYRGEAIEAKVGKACAKLKQAYAAEVAKKAAMKQGWAVREKVLEDGTIKLVCQGGAA